METPEWLFAVTDLDQLAREAVTATLGVADAGPPGPLEVSLLFTDDAAMRRLNATYRGQDKATNVLSFAALDAGASEIAGPILLGDVVVALETTRREARAQGKTLRDHAGHLIVHGTLHLLGFDHEAGEAEARAMEAIEQRVLAGLGIADPYAPAALGGETVA